MLNKLFKPTKNKKKPNIILHSNIAGILQFKKFKDTACSCCLIILKNLPVRAYY